MNQVQNYIKTALEMQGFTEMQIADYFAKMEEIEHD